MLAFIPWCNLLACRTFSRHGLASTAAATVRQLVQLAQQRHRAYEHHKAQPGAKGQGIPNNSKALRDSAAQEGLEDHVNFVDFLVLSSGQQRILLQNDVINGSAQLQTGSCFRTQSNLLVS